VSRIYPQTRNLLDFAVCIELRIHVMIKEKELKNKEVLTHVNQNDQNRFKSGESVPETNSPQSIGHSACDLRVEVKAECLTSSAPSC